jgi:hypothetical protein
MPEAIKQIGNVASNTYRYQDVEVKRAMAVAAALELIALNVQGANSNGVLETEMASLSSYADKIQEALKTA